MKQRLQRILSILCVLALVIGCTALTAFAEGDSVIKVISVQWDDEDNCEGLRPGSVTMKIADKTVMLNADNNWSGAAEAPEGATWEIDEPPQGYTTPPSVFGNGSSATKVVYHHPVRKIDVDASIVWEDDDNAAGLRPESVRINLLADGVICRAPKTVKAISGITVSWDKLPVNKKAPATGPVNYTIDAADPVEGYKPEVNGNTITYTLQKGNLSVSAPSDVNGLELVVTGPDPKVKNGMKLTGSYNIGEVIPGAYVVQETNGDTLVKGYVMDPAASQVGDAAYVEAGAGATLNIKYTWVEPTEAEPNENPMAETGSLAFEIIGPDGYNKKVTYADFTNGTYELDGLVPGEYAVIEKSPEGLVNAYTLKSTSITGAALTVGGEKAATATLINKYAPAPTPAPDAEVLDIPVVKIWNDDNNKDGNRPAFVTVQLFADGVLNESVDITEADGWAHTFTDKPVKNEEGEDIKYTVAELPVAWYTAEVNGTYITNTYKPETTSVSIVKVWDDNNDDQKKRPTSIAVTLLPVGEVYVLNEANGWAVTVDNLPTKLNGEAVTYSWTEQEVRGYTIAGIAVNGMTTTFTNHAVTVPVVPAGQPKPNTFGGGIIIFEEYDTALGIPVLINHVGDCFD